MLTQALFAFLHHARFLVLVVALSIELALFGRGLSLDHARRIQRIDALYGLTALALLVIGFLRVVYFEKGAAHYFGNVFFLAKLTLFLAVGFASIYPTLRFVRWRKDTAAGRAPVVAEAEFAQGVAVRAAWRPADCAFCRAHGARHRLATRSARRQCRVSASSLPAHPDRGVVEHRAAVRPAGIGAGQALMPMPFSKAGWARCPRRRPRRAAGRPAA